MQSILIIAVLFSSLILGFTFISPYIEDGRYNTETKAIEISLQYGGGCAEHKFELKMGACRETYPVQCDANLIDLTTNDFCEALVYRTISINLHDVGLNDSYYTGAHIQIHGSGNSKVLIIFP